MYYTRTSFGQNEFQVPKGMILEVIFGIKSAKFRCKPASGLVYNVLK